MTEEIVAQTINDSSEPMMFDFNDRRIRTFIDESGNPWFVAKDVCEILEYTNSSKAITDHVDEEDRLNNKTLSSLGQRGGWLINESGLYSLIIGSKMPDARRFKHWVTHEVLPQIRKTGSYSSKTPTIDEFLEMIMSNPRLIARSLERMADQQEEIERQRRQLEEQRSHVELANSISVSNDLITITDLCKIICQTGVDMKVRTLFAMMRSDGYLFKNENVPTKKAVDMGVLRLVEHPFVHSDGTTGINKYAKVTGKGQIFFVRKYGSSADQRLIER